MEMRQDLIYYGKLASRKLGLVAGQLELTSKCYQQCPMCSSWKDDASGTQHGVMPFYMVSRIMTELETIPTFEHLSFTGGDPQRYPHLSQLLNVYGPGSLPYKLQINTALTQDVHPHDSRKWREVFHDVRVSLDSHIVEKYQKIRGDHRTTPQEVISRMKEIGHERYQINTVVLPNTINDISAFIDYIEGSAIPGLRKVSFLPIIGKGSFDWEDYRIVANSWKRHSLPFQLSFGDSVPDTRDWTNSESARSVPCYAGNISFHIKSNGDYYPCCLVGGEAIDTSSKFAVGNVFNSSLTILWMRYKPACHYANPDAPCRDICQFKQANINLIGWNADHVKLAMP